MSQTNFFDQYRELHTLELAQLLEIWNHYDSDGSGYIEVGPELDAFLTDMLRAGGEQVTERKLAEFIQGIMELFDVDADGRLGLDEVEELFNGGASEDA